MFYHSFNLDVAKLEDSNLNRQEKIEILKGRVMLAGNLFDVDCDILESGESFYGIPRCIIFGQYGAPNSLNHGKVFEEAAKNTMMDIYFKSGIFYKKHESEQKKKEMIYQNFIFDEVETKKAFEGKRSEIYGIGETLIEKLLERGYTVLDSEKDFKGVPLSIIIGKEFESNNMNHKADFYKVAGKLGLHFKTDDNFINYGEKFNPEFIEEMEEIRGEGGTPVGSVDELEKRYLNKGDEED